MSAVTVAPQPETPALDSVLGEIAGRAVELDRTPRFPLEDFQALLAVGVPQLAADRSSCSLTREAALVRAVAAVDASTARILDGHFNGVERVALLAAPALRDAELAAVADGTLLVGVWGADPGPGEGSPARLEQAPDGGLIVRGVKTFCSGAGGVQRALIVVRGLAPDERRVAYVDTRDGLAIDRDWYRASGLRASESHRVELAGCRVLAVLGQPNELTREPWFSRDAVRTAATWAGIADAIAAAAITSLEGRSPDDLRLLAVGRMRVAHATIDRWLEHTTALLEDPAAPPPDPRALAGECRLAIADAARVVAEAAAAIGGSRALVSGGTLDRARRDLDLFLLQHRLEPTLVDLGRRALHKAHG